MEELTVAARHYLDADKTQARKYALTSRTAGTWRRDRVIWGKFTNYLGSPDPWKATPEDIAGWCVHLVEAGLNPNTLSTYLTTLNLFYERLGKGYFVGNPGKGVRSISPARHHVVQATMRGIRRLHANPPTRMKPISLETLDKMTVAEGEAKPPDIKRSSAKSEPPAPDDSQQRRERFNSLLDAAVKKPSQAD